MRKRFEQQLSLDLIPITDCPVNYKCRDASEKISLALLTIFKNSDYNEKIFDLLESKLSKNQLKNGRLGMDLWQIFVLAQFRVGLNIGYDRLLRMVDNDRSLRILLGIETSGFQREENRKKISYQNILDNVGLLTDDILREINEVIVQFGNNEVFKKKVAEASILKTDTFVVETNVHFPTDYGLFWDASRKCLDMIKKIMAETPELSGWRKMNSWRKNLKTMCRQIGQNSKKGGKNKEEKAKELVEGYVNMGENLIEKILIFLPLVPQSLTNQLIIDDLIEYIRLAKMFMDQLQRRVINGETIPQEEKLFSIFEQYTEWIKKGKTNPSVELGKKLAITTNQSGLIIHYKVVEKQSDSEILIDIAAQVLATYKKIQSWSVDKGFYSKTNKELLETQVSMVIMPKKGKLNKTEHQQEHKKAFIILRNKHSAVESNINELEHRGLNRCPDKGYQHFKRYVALGICAYNLHKIGAKLIKDELERQKRVHKKAA